MASDYKIGSTSSVTSLDALTTPVPDPFETFKPYSEVVTTGSGREVGLGWAESTWDFGYLDDAQRNQLRTFCTTASNQVYVRVYNDSLSTPAWKIYRAIMVWMHEGEERRNDKRLKLTLKFKLIEDVTPA
jgi:hypothetical protein